MTCDSLFCWWKCTQYTYECCDVEPLKCWYAKRLKGWQSKRKKTKLNVTQNMKISSVYLACTQQHNKSWE